MIFKKSLSLMNNPVFRKTIENVRRKRDIKLVTTKRKNYLVSEPNYHTTKFFTEDRKRKRNEKNTYL